MEVQELRSLASNGTLTTVLLYNGPLLCGFNVPIKVSKTFFRTAQPQPVCYYNFKV